MKTSPLLFLILLLSTINTFSQSNMIINNGGAVTVQGNISITCLPVPLSATHIPSASQIIWNWSAVENAAGYKWNTTNDYNTAMDLGAVTTKTENGLICNTEYTRFVWAYGTCGISLSAILIQTTSTCPFSCGQVFTDTRNNKTYNTVQIGTQCWMSQNLNYGTRVSGVTEQTNNGTPEKYCYSNAESNCDIYGGLYQWAEAVQYQDGATNTTSWNPLPSGNVQGICPTGWHVPSDAEWTILSDHLGGGAVAGGKMKETGYTHWGLPNAGATNSSGFTALPGGNDYYFIFYDLRYYAAFWTATEHSATVSWYRAIWYDYSSLNRMNAYVKANGYSIRCLKD